MSENLKTIKELADEFNVSKQAVRKRLTEEFRANHVESETFITQQTGKPTTIFLDNYEDLQHDITVSLRRTFNAIRNKQDKKQKVNPENYIFGAMRNTFEVWYSEYLQSLS
ncbi:TPA: hypothetical protein IUV08_003357 [Enterococcus faecalis]|jgi:transcription initiation factor IIE alpha subunit|nr:hypothetical protein [Enterococcus faecalis]HAP4177617.1 hypothetical protein [Enterococcus faecalis]